MESIVLSVVLPVYNEEKSIQKVVFDHVRVLEQIQNQISGWEIVCLDDASTDNTPQILAAVSKGMANMRIVRHPQNQGIYKTYMDLFKEARGTHIYQTASDGQWPAENCARMLKALIQSQADLLIGVRENRREIYSPWRRLLSFVFNGIPKLFFHLDTKDANGIKLGRREIFRLNLISKSFFGEIERIVLARAMNCQVSYCPIDFLPRVEGKAKGANFLNIAATLNDFFRYVMIYFSPRWKAYFQSRGQQFSNEKYLS